MKQNAGLTAKRAAGCVGAVVIVGLSATVGFGGSASAQTERPSSSSSSTIYEVLVGIVPPGAPTAGAPVTAATVVAPAAAVAGVQVTTSTVAPTTAATVKVVDPAPAPTNSVLGTVTENNAEEVPFTGANSGTYTAVGAGLTAAGALLISAARRKQRS
jgi:hypothetical protein